MEFPKREDNSQTIHKLAEFIKKRIIQNRKNTNNVLSTTLKNRRLELNMTLEEMTKDICSKAYLSKFENNLLTIDEYIARALCERVTLDYDKAIGLEDSNMLPKAIKSYLFKNKESLKDLCEENESCGFVASNKLALVFYKLLIEDYKEIEVILMQVEQVKTALSDLEFVCLLTLFVEYNICTNQFVKAYDYSKLLLDLDLENKELRQIYLEQRFIIACNLNRLLLAHECYINIRKEYDSGFPLKTQFYNKILYLETFCNSSSIDSIESLLDDFIPTEYSEDYWYSYCLILIKLEKFFECVELISKYELYKEKFVCLFAFSIYQILAMKRRASLRNKTSKNNYSHDSEDLELIKKLNNALEIIKKEKIRDIDRNFLKLIRLQIMNKEPFDLIDFLKDVAIPLDKVYQHRFYSKYYAFLLLSLLGSNCRYKDAYLLAINDYNLLGEAAYINSCINYTK